MTEPRDEIRIRGDEIIDGVVYRRCPECGELKPLDEFGLRRMAGYGHNGGDRITNQSWCRDCRTPEAD